jgi:hypothetical protein
VLCIGYISQEEHDERRRKIVDEMTGTQIAPGGGRNNRRQAGAPPGQPSRGGDGSSRTRKQVDRAERDAAIAAAANGHANGNDNGEPGPAAAQAEVKTLRREDIKQEVKRIVAAKKEKKDKYAIARPPPEWGPIPPENALLHIFDLPSKTWSTARVTIKIDRHPFAKGSLRFAHFMTGLQDIPGLGASESTYVAKISIDPFEERDSYFQDVMMQMLAKEYARKYNSYNPPKKVHFIKAWLIELIDRPVKPLYVSTLHTAPLLWRLIHMCYMSVCHMVVLALNDSLQVNIVNTIIILDMYLKMNETHLKHSHILPMRYP